MILDSTNLLSNQQSLALAAGTYNSANVIDLSANRDIGAGEELSLFAQVVTGFTGGTSLQMALVTSAAPGLTTPTTLFQTAAIPLASLQNPGFQIFRGYVPINPSGLPLRYLGLIYTLVGTFTAGTVSAGLVYDLQANIGYPEGLNVSAF
jgi:hypothetical protein